jgi:hypothetical protein
MQPISAAKIVYPLFPLAHSEIVRLNDDQEFFKRKSLLGVAVIYLLFGIKFARRYSMTAQVELIVHSNKHANSKIAGNTPTHLPIPGIRRKINLHSVWTEKIADIRHDVKDNAPFLFSWI